MATLVRRPQFEGTSQKSRRVPVLASRCTGHLLPLAPVDTLPSAAELAAEPAWSQQLAWYLIKTPGDFFDPRNQDFSLFGPFFNGLGRADCT